MSAGFATVFSRACLGVEAPLVTIEVHLANGIPSFTLVGLPETSVREARERVRSAIIQTGFEFPAKRITINLAPADLPKAGGRFDLAIAVGILAASGQIDEQPIRDLLGEYEFLGELSLRGDIRQTSAVLPSIIAANTVARKVIIPSLNRADAAICKGSTCFCANDLAECIAHLNHTKPLLPESYRPVETSNEHAVDFADVVGQAQAKRALTIAATGQHNILLVGSQGTGKSMLAQRLPSILPSLSEQQAIECAAIASIADIHQKFQCWRERPFRSPHHGSSLNALIGGGAIPKPGEISLAHHGILFLDELPEFGRKSIDALREPMQNHDIHLSRAACKVRYPAHFQLVAAMNPSPTGDIHDGRTTPDKILQYINKVSGPLLDRIDLQVDVSRQQLSAMAASGEQTSAVIRQRVVAAQQKQQQRQGRLNNALSVAQLNQHCQLSRDDQAFVHSALDKLGASHRRLHKVLKVARSIADLDDSAHIKRKHLAESISYRALDSIVNQLSSC
ncbi:YifB family Mg chelatase-like AAA ATPase [Alteromonas oceanisediminis]|uniref:YifB family Mg chelatase-like AAA ATPase n=1 Tax=Alteromonas oceanisediminis TaxID=2836180 RepID=UPI001BD946A4|nr:YifB family Mg chelatase-like AAA ATPase [Alteromonas oceanisediminis]MBT0586209.1 YifB family Mg chelatase-like AAA ATPase [Alteromonas oceanisediminis]